MFCLICAQPIVDPNRPCNHCGAVPPDAPRPAAPLPVHHGRRWTINTLPLLAVVVVLLGAGAQRLEHRRYVEQRYAAGRSALLVGDLLTAKSAFTDAGGYHDAKNQRLAVDNQLAPFVRAEDRAAAAIDDGRFDDAIALLVPVAQAIPDDDRSWMLQAEARSARFERLDTIATADEHAGDWLGEQQALAAMVADHPDDASLSARLATVERDHSPLLYARNGDLYLSSLDGLDERAVVKGLGVAWPMWSPDRTRIAFTVRSPDRQSIAGDLYVVNPDGSGLRLLTSEFLPFGWPVWSPDGTRIAFSNPSNFQVANGSGSIDLSIVELATGHISDVTRRQFDYAASPTWSPDGTRLAYVDRIRVQMGNGFDFRNGDVHLYDLATGRTTNLSGDHLQNERQVAWSPAGDRLLVYTDPGDRSSDDEGQIVIWDLARDQATIVPSDVRSPEPPVWSPDGSRIAWVEGTDVVKLWSAAGIEWVRVTTEIGPALSWAPDGHALFAPGGTKSDPSYVIAVDDQFGVRERIKLDFDVNNSTTGLPVWSPRTSPARSPSTGGTALDPA
jgi:Tol biopolymer transport system component